MPIQILVANREHVPGMLAIYGEAVTDTAITWETEIPSEEDFAGRLAKVQAGGYPWLVAMDGETVAGYAYAGAFRERYGYRFCCESTIYLAEAFCGLGLGRRLYGSLLEILTRQGFAAAIGVITVPNEASIGLHEALGFRQIGVFEEIGYKFGRWHTAAFLQRDLNPRSDCELEPFAEMVQAGALDDLLDR